jgi:hypothetical protein
LLVRAYDKTAPVEARLRKNLELDALLKHVGMYTALPTGEIRATLCTHIGSQTDVPWDRCRACVMVVKSQVFKSRLERHTVRHEHEKKKKGRP